MELHHAAFLPDPTSKVTGAVDIEWIAAGAALQMRQGEAGQPPLATWIIGRDDDESDYVVLYADNRGVSRVYRMSFAGGLWRLRRDAPGFSQRFEALLDPDGRAIRGRWEKSADGKTWEHDFNIDYLREDPR